MDQFPRTQYTFVNNTDNLVQSFMSQVYGWMSCGLLLTSFVAWYASKTPVILQFIFSNHIFLFGLIIAQLALVFAISGMTNKLSSSVATTMFMLYSSLTGLTLSSVFILYTASSIASTFMVISGMFGIMTLYGYTTKRDLSSLGNLLFMALVGVILASLVNIWLKSPALMWLVPYIGVIVFVGLTAYDTQKLKVMCTTLSINNKDQFHNYSIVGALTLYLDFINMFLMLLRILNNRR